MAEERLIDEDKDKKYRIKVNADGEEELVVEGGEEQAEEYAEAEFVAPETDENDEEAAVMTPEQYAAKLEQARREKEERQEKARKLLDSAMGDFKSRKYSTALEYLEQAEEADKENGDIYALRMRVYTRDFTDYGQIREAAESAEGVAKYASAEVKEAMSKKAGTTLDENIAPLRNKVSALNRQNEEKKAERAVRFKADRNKAVIVWLAIVFAFGACIALSLYFGSIIYTVSTGTYLILTCIFAGCAVLLLLAMAFAARKLVIASRRIKMNERNTSTELGRELLDKQATLKAFIDVRDSLKAE